jgi:hypothetical protein
MGRVRCCPVLAGGLEKPGSPRRFIGDICGPFCRICGSSQSAGGAWGVSLQWFHRNPTSKGITMNVLKNFEAVFVVALAVGGCASYLSSVPGKAGADAAQAFSTSIATPSRMAVVTVTGKRMSGAQKQRSLEDERRLAKQGSVMRERI